MHPRGESRCRAIACFVGFCARWTPLAPGRGGSRHAFAPAPAHERVRGRCDGRRRLPAAELPCSTRAPSGPPGALRAPQRRPHGFETRAGCDSGREGRRGAGEAVRAPLPSRGRVRDTASVAPWQRAGASSRRVAEACRTEAVSKQIGNAAGRGTRHCNARHASKAASQAYPNGINRLTGPPAARIVRPRAAARAPMRSQGRHRGACAAEGPPVGAGSAGAAAARDRGRTRTVWGPPYTAKRRSRRAASLPGHHARPCVGREATRGPCTPRRALHPHADTRRARHCIG